MILNIFVIIQALIILFLSVKLYKISKIVYKFLELNKKLNEELKLVNNELSRLNEIISNFMLYVADILESAYMENSTTKIESNISGSDNKKLN